MSIQSELDVFVSEVRGFNNFILFKDGVCTHKEIGSVCYSSLTYVEEVLVADQLFIAFDHSNYHVSDTYDFYEWSEWVMCDSFVSDSIISRVISDNDNVVLFEINTKCDYNLMVAGMIMLRQPFEFNPWSWSKFRCLGFTEEESYALACNFYMEHDKLIHIDSSIEYYSQHSLMPKGQRFDTYLGKGYSEGTSTLYSGIEEDYQPILHESICGLTYSEKCGVINTVIKGDDIKKSCEYNLNLMKGVK